MFCFRSCSFSLFTVTQNSFLPYGLDPFISEEAQYSVFEAMNQYKEKLSYTK